MANQVDARKYERLTGPPLRGEGIDDAISLYGGALLTALTALRADRAMPITGGNRTPVTDIITAGDGTEIDPDTNAWIFQDGLADSVTGIPTTGIRKVVITATTSVWIAVYGQSDYLGYVAGTKTVPAWLDGAATFEEQVYDQFGRIQWDNGEADQNRQFVKYWMGDATSGSVEIVVAEDVKAVVVSPDAGVTSTVAVFGLAK